MQEGTKLQGIDPLLHAFVCALTDRETEDQLAALIREHADPIINRIIRKKLNVPLSASRGDVENQEALELAGDLRAVIISDLQRVRAHPEQKTIIDFCHYVALKCYSACADYFRARHPNRSRLKAMLRHHLKKSDQFAIWEAEDRRWFCGFSTWQSENEQNENKQTCSLEHLRNAVDGGGAVPKNLLPSGDFARHSPASLLAFVFDKAMRPIELDHLVAIVAGIWDVRDLPVESYDEGQSKETIEAATAPVDKLVEERCYLERLWKEVCGLPALQRSALLLNLRDPEGGSVIAFIPHLGIASKQEVAELAGIPYDEFTDLWNNLPLDDASVAKRFGLSRQQVINLRKTARERLARRMAALGRKPLAERAGGNKSGEFTD